VVQTDLEEQRRWQRQRETDLCYLGELQLKVAEKQLEVDELQVEVRAMSKEFADWRAYIHELEGRLGLPLSGVEPGQQPPGGSANGDSPEPDTQRLEDATPPPA
jgi:uncharacterized coiled-coil protein SlyX